MKGRFAPSPTGRMHLGNVFSAMLSWLSVKSKGGEWVLRIEDLDPQRSRLEYAEQLMDDLLWLGMTWDEGPQLVNGRCTPDAFFQSRRHDIYEQHLDRLRNMKTPTGEESLVYPCYCTRADILATQAPHESDGRVVYKGTCRPTIKNPGNGGPIASDGVTSSDSGTKVLCRVGAAAQRLIVPDRTITFLDGHYGEQSVNLATQCGDFIVRRKDGAWAYQLAVVVDDALMDITEVVRGKDLLLSSPQQMYVAELLGYPAPQFIHLPLLVNEQGQRLSKRDKSLDMGCLRERYTPQEIIGLLAYHARLTDVMQPLTLTELLPQFSWDKIPQQDIVVSAE